MLAQLLPADLFSILLVFARIGAAVMLFPGFGENHVNPRVRLLIAATLSVVVTPVVMPTLPRLPDNLIEMFLLLGGEIVIGLFIGALTRLLVSSLQIAGTIIGFQTSLANAMVFDPINAQQGSVIAAYLNIVGVFLLFITDLHHLMLLALTDSYTLFVPGVAPPIGDVSETAVRFLARSFGLGMQIAAPFMVVAMLFYISLGLLARLMPQVQIFFIAMPLQIMLGFFVMSLTISAAMFWFLESFETGMHGLLDRG